MRACVRTFLSFFLLLISLPCLFYIEWLWFSIYFFIFLVYSLLRLCVLCIWYSLSLYFIYDCVSMRHTFVEIQLKLKKINKYIITYTKKNGRYTDRKPHIELLIHTYILRERAREWEIWVHDSDSECYVKTDRALTVYCHTHTHTASATALSLTVILSFSHSVVLFIEKQRAYLLRGPI